MREQALWRYGAVLLCYTKFIAGTTLFLRTPRRHDALIRYDGRSIRVRVRLRAVASVVPRHFATYHIFGR